MRTQTQILGKVSITVDKYYHNYINEYERLTIVSERGTGIAYISRKDVPSNIYLNDREYWIPLGYPANLDTEAIAQINNIIDELIVSKADASDLELYAKKEDISDMATKTEVASCAKLADIANMATKTELELKADKADLNLKVDLDTYNTIVDRVKALEDTNKIDLTQYAKTSYVTEELAKKADVDDLVLKADKSELIKYFSQLSDRPTKLSDFVNDLFVAEFHHNNGTYSCEKCDEAVYNSLLRLQTNKADKTDIDNINKRLNDLDLSNGVTDELIQALKDIATLKKANQADWNETDESTLGFIKNKPEIPVIVQSDWDCEDETDNSFIKNKPTIVQSDWDEIDENSLAFIKNKPAPFEQTQADWAEIDTNSDAFIKNKPNIKAINDKITELEKQLLDYKNKYDDLMNKYAQLLIFVNTECVKSAEIDVIRVLDKDEDFNNLSEIDTRTMYITPSTITINNNK